MLHDTAQVREHFPQTLLLAREPVAWGATAEVLTDANWARAQTLHEPFDEQAGECETGSPARGHHPRMYSQPPALEATA